MPQISESKEEREIITVAERFFDTLGVDNTSIADIAYELNIPPSDLYRLYLSKHEIVEAVGRRLLAETEHAADVIVKRRTPAQKGPGREKLKAAISAVRDSHVNRLNSHLKLHELLKIAFDEKWLIVEQHVQALEKLLAEIILQGNIDGEFDVDDTELAAMLVRSSCIRFCDPRLIAESVRDVTPTLDQVISFCILGLS